MLTAVCRRRRSTPIGLLLLAVAGLSARAAAEGEQMHLGYKDIPAIVRQANAAVRAGRGQVDAARSRTGSLARSFLPTVSAEGGYESFRTADHPQKSQPYGALEARVNLFRSGRDAAAERARAAERALAQAGLDRTEHDEIAAVRALYWELAFNRAMASVAEQAAARNRRHIASVERRIDRGLTTVTDRIEFEMLGIELEELVHGYEHEAVILEAELAPHIGRPAGTRLQIDVLPEMPADPPAMDTEDGPAVRAARAREAATRAAARENSPGLRPEIDIYGGYHLYTLRERDSMERRLRDDTVAGGRLYFPLFNGFRSWRETRALYHRADAHAAEVAHEKARLAAMLAARREELKHEKELISTGTKQARLSETYLKETLGEYERGVKNAPDLAGAVVKWLTTQTRLNERRRDHAKIHAELLRLLGQ